ncbi:MAG: entericidin A/B family lipoprotein [Sphingomonadales bacterium]|nr:entericidin A/B family lipoprotein [Sphingomonadales bacterium]
MVRKVLISLAATGMLLVSACNTVEGVGRDVESVGDTVADAAD